MSTNLIAFYKEMTSFTNKGRTAEKTLLSTACRTEICRTEGSGSGDLIGVYKYRMKGKGEKRDRLFPVAPNDRTRDNRHKLKPSVFAMNLRNLSIV